MQWDEINKTSRSKEIGSIWKWLDLNIGQSWDNICHKLCKQFNMDRQIVSDKFLGDVQLPGDKGVEYTYYIDDNGFFCKRLGLQLKNKKILFENVSIKRRDQIIKWVGVRKIGLDGNKLYWFVPVELDVKEDIIVDWGGRYWSRWAELTYSIRRWSHTVKLDGSIDRYATLSLKIPSYIKGEQFSNEDVKFWNSLPEWLRKNILCQPINQE